MSYTDPYTTTYGSLVNIHTIKSELVTYIIHEGVDNLIYGRMSGSIPIVFITGYSLLEKELGSWEHPMIVDIVGHGQVVAVDLRPYVKVTEEQPINLDDHIRNKNGYDFVMMLAILTARQLAGELSKHKRVYNNITAAFGVWVSSIVSPSLNLDLAEKLYVEVVAAYYANLLFYQEDEVDDMLDAIKARVINTKFAIKLKAKQVEDIINKLDARKPTMELLVEYIQVVINEDKAKQIDLNIFSMAINNSWFGPGNNGTVMNGMEHIPTWMTLVYFNLVDRSYKRTRMATILNTRTKSIGAKDLEDEFKNVIKDTSTYS